MLRIYRQLPEYVDKLADIYADNLRALNYLAELKAGGPGGVAGTLPIYEKILKLDPQNTSVLNKLGIMRVNAGLLSDAEGCFKRAIDLSPQFTDAQFNLGICLLKQGKMAESIPCFSRTVELNPDLRDARLYLALTLFRTGRTKDALPHVQYVLKADPNDEAAVALLAEIAKQDAAAFKQ
jgi:tetratricopeptide (TPR) repeat protein